MLFWRKEKHDIIHAGLLPKAKTLSVAKGYGTTVYIKELQHTITLTLVFKTLSTSIHLQEDIATTSYKFATLYYIKQMFTLIMSQLTSR